ncbi:DUF2794 domain-containing protein [Devosia lacusdianchii]|jgi:hypothetical protein|uniref:DUF2794 domain-containing protein n=1 Tax=Devosia lacusdianchii TaxID=2917991 RepID=UPI001F06EEF2|nr:DUF2794 domain-containing protein [Devosia sp. JXJ CY 41]
MRSRYGVTLFAGATVGLLVLSGQAQACSDLPNICAMNAQHHQSMVDISAGYAYGDYYGEDEYYGDDYYDSGYYSGDLDYSAYSDDPGRSLSNEAASFVSAVAAQQAALAERLQDPGFAKAYERYTNGGWDYFQDQAGARPGEYCAAFYWRGDGMVRLSGPGGDYPGALITFWGPDIPTPGSVETITVTLDQADGAPATVKAFNYHLAGDAWGAIALAVPTIEAALDGMEDRQSFMLSIGGRMVAQVEWRDGLTAKSQLERCLRG